MTTAPVLGKVWGRLDSVEWNGGLEWNGGMERYFGNFNWWSPLYKDHLLTKTTSLYKPFYFNV